MIEGCPETLGGRRSHLSSCQWGWQLRNAPHARSCSRAGCIPSSICGRRSFDGLAMSGLTAWTTVFVAVSLGLHLWAAEGPQKKGTLLGEPTPSGSLVRRSCIAGASLMALLCLANTPLPAPWVQWLEGEPERLPVRQTPYVAARGPLPSGEFVPPAAAVAAAVSATGKAVGDELGRHSSTAVGGGSVPEGGAAALQQAGAAAAAAAVAGAARNASGSAGSTGLGAAATAENVTAKLENVRYPTITLSRSSPSRGHPVGKSTFFSRTRTLTHPGTVGDSHCCAKARRRRPCG